MGAHKHCRAGLALHHSLLLATSSPACCFTKCAPTAPAPPSMSPPFPESMLHREESWEGAGEEMGLRQGGTQQGCVTTPWLRLCDVEVDASDVSGVEKTVGSSHTKLECGQEDRCT